MKKVSTWRPAVEIKQTDNNYKIKVQLPGVNKDDIEVEHIWADHFNQHMDECASEDEFDNYRNNIGDLLVLPKSFNASYGDAPYVIKVEQYFSQNILAQTLNEKKYVNNPDFVRFMNSSGLNFKAYDEFKKNSIVERAELYKAILLWNWNEERYEYL